jgi:hypothetical protein
MKIVTIYLIPPWRLWTLIAHLFIVEIIRVVMVRIVLLLAIRAFFSIILFHSIKFLPKMSGMVLMDRFITRNPTLRDRPPVQCQYLFRHLHLIALARHLRSRVIPDHIDKSWVQDNPTPPHRLNGHHDCMDLSHRHLMRVSATLVGNAAHRTAIIPATGIVIVVQGTVEIIAAIPRRHRCNNHSSINSHFTLLHGRLVPIGTVLTNNLHAPPIHPRVGIGRQVLLVVLPRIYLTHTPLLPLVPITSTIPLAVMILDMTGGIIANYLSLVSMKPVVIWS